MFARIKNMLFPCQAKLDAVIFENQQAHQRLIDVCKLKEITPQRKKPDFAHVSDLRHIRNPS